MEAPGMTYKTLRDQIAMAALISTPGWMQDLIEHYPETARRCYLLADAMLKARESSSTESPTRT